MEGSHLSRVWLGWAGFLTLNQSNCCPHAEAVMGEWKWGGKVDVLLEPAGKFSLLQGPTRTEHLASFFQMSLFEFHGRKNIKPTMNSWHRFSVKTVNDTNYPVRKGTHGALLAWKEVGRSHPSNFLRGPWLAPATMSTAL